MRRVRPSIASTYSCAGHLLAACLAPSLRTSHVPEQPSRAAMAATSSDNAATLCLDHKVKLLALQKDAAELSLQRRSNDDMLCDAFVALMGEGVAADRRRWPPEEEGSCAAAGDAGGGTTRVGVSSYLDSAQAAADGVGFLDHVDGAFVVVALVPPARETPEQLPLRLGGRAHDALLEGDRDELGALLLP